MGKRKHARDREDFLYLGSGDTIVERQVKELLGTGLDELPLSSIVTPVEGRYKGIHFTVEGFDATEYPEKPVKYCLWGKVGDRWVEIIVPSTKLEYLGRMGFKAWKRRGTSIPTRPITMVEHASELARGAFSEPTDKIVLIEHEGEY